MLKGALDWTYTRCYLLIIRKLLFIWYNMDIVSIGGVFIRYLLLTTLFLFGFILFAQPVSASVDYTVQQGDTLYSISEENDVEIETLIASNPSVEDPDAIEAGEEIIIPDDNGTPFTVTAYTAGEESTGKEEGDPGYGVTASGNTVEENQTIACPSSLDFGTSVHIPELEDTFICEDRGSAITNGHLDIYKEDLDDALEFGVQDLQVQFDEEFQ